MARKAAISRTQASEAVARAGSIRGAARDLGVSPGAVSRALARVRTAEEFRGSLAVRAPRTKVAPLVWDLERIRAARDAQMRGHFELPVRLAEAMRTDDALFTAYHNRIAPQSAVQAILVPQGSSRGEAVCKRAREGASAPRSVLEGIQGTLANHGLAIGYIEHTTNEDGTRVDFRLTEWPLEHVRWNESTEQLETRVRDGGAMVPIVHGDGRWVVFRKFGAAPWVQEACILPAALVWAAHGNGIKDWAAGSASHGQAKIMGELPEGVSLQSAEGELSPEAAAFLEILQDIVSGEAGAGIRPAGAKTDFLANGSTAWQVFSELIVNREKAAARIYLGTDASLGSVGGAPGVDIAILFGVASTKLQGDFQAIEQALASGFYDPWCAINFGTSQYAPRLAYQLPDPDASAKSKETAEAHDRLLDTIAKMRAQQMDVTQDVVDRLAIAYGVSPAPTLATDAPKVVPLTLAPTDLAAVVRVSEARASQGLPPFGDQRDDMTISQFKEWLIAQREASTARAEADAESGSES